MLLLLLLYVYTNSNDTRLLYKNKTIDFIFINTNIHLYIILYMYTSASGGIVSYRINCIQVNILNYSPQSSSYSFIRRYSIAHIKSRYTIYSNCISHTPYRVPICNTLPINRYLIIGNIFYSIINNNDVTYLLVNGIYFFICSLKHYKQQRWAHREILTK